MLQLKPAPMRHSKTGLCAPGHVICVAGNCFIDAATQSLHRDFGIFTPSVIVAKVFDLSSRVISELDLSDQVKIWWFDPPPVVDIALPIEPSNLVAEYANELISNLCRY